MHSNESVFTNELAQFGQQKAEVGVGGQRVGHAEEEEVMLLKQATVTGFSSSKIFNNQLVEPVDRVHAEAVVSVRGWKTWHEADGRVIVSLSGSVHWR
jgi:hypothetical protein